MEYKTRGPLCRSSYIISEGFYEEAGIDYITLLFSSTLDDMTIFSQEVLKYPGRFQLLLTYETGFG